MWMTLNSRDNYARVVPGIRLLTILLPGLVVACASTTGPAPDSPRARLVLPEPSMKLRAADAQSPVFTLDRVVVHRLEPGDPEVRRHLGKIDRDILGTPIRIAINTRGIVPLGEGTSSLVVVLNGTIIHNTWIVPEANGPIIAYLPDDSLIRNRNVVTLRWIGRPNDLFERQQLSFLASEIRN